MVDSGVQHGKWGEYIGFQRKRDYCSKLKKGKLNTKKLLGILDEQEPSVQSKVWSWGNMYLPKYGKWSSQHLYLLWVSKWVPCQKESQPTFIQQKAHLCLGPCCLDNTLKIKNSNWLHQVT